MTVCQCVCSAAHLAACLSVQLSPGDDRQKLWSNPGPGTSFSRGPIRTGFLRSKGVPSTRLISPAGRLGNWSVIVYHWKSREQSQQHLTTSCDSIGKSFSGCVALDWVEHPQGHMVVKMQLSAQIAKTSEQFRWSFEGKLLDSFRNTGFKGPVCRI